MAHAVADRARWERLEGLFHRAMNFPLPEREPQARIWCQDDPDLLSELLELLASDSSVESLLASSASSAPSAPSPAILPGPLAESEDPRIGQEVGPFQIERMLGRGGMGVVYLARRVHGGFSQTVAVKMIARHLGSGPALRQFHLERDVLARLEHKNISRLVDAGTSPEGTPYVAMEYIEGCRLDHLSDDGGLSREAKLRLILQLCDAVAFVHRNLILHRDLKPSNVMVTGDGCVKLLDFGIVKLLGASAALTSEMTQAGMRPVTLRYASPEHVRGEPLSTTSDIYSVGMILARTVTGRLPDGASARSGIKSLDTSHDLAAIIHKATHPEADRRYLSINALAADILRLLAGRPVSARSDAWTYRAARFCQRNRGILLASSLVLLVLAVGLALMRHEASLADEQHRRAEAGVQEERKLAHLLLFDYFQTLADIPGSTDAQHQAATEAIAYLDELNRVTSSPELELDTVQAYQKLGLLLGSPYVANLGDPTAAIATLQKAETLGRKLLGRDPRNLDYRVAFIDVEKALAQVYFALKQPEKSLVLLLPSAEMARSIAADPHATGKMLNQCGGVLKTLADAYSQHANSATQSFEKAVQAFEQSGVMYQASVDRGSRLYTGPVIANLFLGVLERTVDADIAASLFRKALAQIAALPPEEQSKVAMVRLDQTCREKLGGIYLSLGRRSEADALLQPMRAPALRAIAADPVDTRARDDLIAQDTTVLNATPLHDSPATRALMQEYLDTTDFLVRTHPASHEWQFVHAEALLNFARLFIDLGDRHSAAPYLARGLPEVLAIASQPDADSETLSLAASALLFARRDPTHDPELAVVLAQRAIAGTHPPTADQFLTLAEAQHEARSNDAAKASTRQALALLSAHPASLGNAVNRVQARALLQALSTPLTEIVPKTSEGPASAPHPLRRPNA